MSKEQKIEFIDEWFELKPVDFKILECTDTNIIVNREPMNQAELNMMRNAAVDAIARKKIEKG